MTGFYSYKAIRIFCFGLLLILNLVGGMYFYLELGKVSKIISEPILYERPYLSQVLNLQKMTSKLDLHLHKQLTGKTTETLVSTRLIDKILLGMKPLEKVQVLHSSNKTFEEMETFSKELRRLKVALIYYRDSRNYDSTSSSTEELFEIIDESMTKINLSINGIISAVRQQMSEHDTTVINSAEFLQKGLLFYLALIILGNIIVIYIFNNFISLNLRQLIEGTIQLGEGNLEWRFRGNFDDKFGRLGLAFNDMAGKIADSKREILSQSEELAESNRQLRKEEQKAQNYLDVAGAMMAALNANGDITLINRQACNILNISEEEALGKNWFDCFLSEEIAEEVKGVFDKLMAGEIELVEYYENPVLTSDGKERIIAFHNTVLTNEQGDIEGVFFSGEDITLRKRAEIEQESLKEQLRQVQKMEAVGTLAGGIAHDFNNILTAILGYAEFIKNDTPESSQTQDDIDQILKAGYRAKELVGQILAFSRKKEMELLPMYPQVIVKETLKLLRSTTPATVSIIQVISEDCRMIKADPTGLHQVLINLFTNAVHAIDEKGEVTVKLQEEYLTAQALLLKPELSPGPYVHLAITDSGSGMDQSTVNRIFDPFFTTKEVGKGTGMGLSVVYGIVESHGGFINVKSEPGRGSTFSVFFPVIEDAEEEIVEVETMAQSETGTERILFVDDEKSILKIGERILEKMGYEVTAESSSVKAFDIFKSSPDLFDLVITDHSMPEMSGTELVAAILRVRPDMRIIVCSGYNTKVTTENYREKGINVFINKPYDKKVLSDAIREALNIKV